MFKSLFKTPQIMSPALRDEIQSLCRDQQIARLTMPHALRRDVGLDCGCDTPRARSRWPLIF